MKYKTAELTGALLDTAVAKAEGILVTEADEHPSQPGYYRKTRQEWGGEHIVKWVSSDGEEGGWEPLKNRGSPSTDWALAGPIIAREKISVYEQYGGWVAGYGIKAEEGECFSTLTGGGPASIEFDGATGYGDTPLLAVMRAFVTSKLGDTVELP